MCAITETWLKEGDEIGRVALRPEGYEVLSSPCPMRSHTGIAIIYKEDLKITKSRDTSLGLVNAHILKSALARVHTHWVCFIGQMTIHSWHS